MANPVLDGSTAPPATDRRESDLTAVSPALDGCTAPSPRLRGDPAITGRKTHPGDGPSGQRARRHRSVRVADRPHTTAKPSRGPHPAHPQHFLSSAALTFSRTPRKMDTAPQASMLLRINPTPPFPIAVINADHRSLALFLDPRLLEILEWAL